jgi:hypothetical protein|tara:strand:- start:340 stop:507 length:168 start_codon:yes stop_codon:yes gene_type:complete
MPVKASMQSARDLTQTYVVAEPMVELWLQLQMLSQSEQYHDQFIYSTTTSSLSYG